ncbi:hypothetical protein R1flu_006079 [Riccia fluitans]|uniref:Uncharacterized protein n=1 Tax=Riccia fluitans TaxID=41844 RepID=A0ABD1YVV2_9MARC
MSIHHRIMSIPLVIHSKGTGLAYPVKSKAVSIKFSLVFLVKTGMELNVESYNGFLRPVKVAAGLSPFWRLNVSELKRGIWRDVVTLSITHDRRRNAMSLESAKNT